MTSRTLLVALLLSVAVGVAATGCTGDADFDAGRAAYDAQDYRRARDAFTLATERDGEAASPELLHWAALASLRTGELDAAEELSSRAALAGSPFVALREFLRGNVAFARSEIAAEQARAVEAEPFAFDVAIGHAETACDAWAQAAAARDDWPGARRNAERAWLRAEALRREKTEVEQKRKTKRAGGGPPRINAVRLDPQQKPSDDAADQRKQPQPPTTDGTGDDQGQDPALALAEGELAADQVLRLFDTLRTKEDEKLAARRARRRARSANVERDW